jgi:hypothetical protein
MTGQNRNQRSRTIILLSVAAFGAVLNVLSRPFILRTAHTVHDVLLLFLFIDIAITGVAMGLAVWMFIPAGQGPARTAARAFGALLVFFAATFIGFIWSFAFYGIR